jgi:hypothetical protein
MKFGTTFFKKYFWSIAQSILSLFTRGFLGFEAMHYICDLQEPKELKFICGGCYFTVQNGLCKGCPIWMSPILAEHDGPRSTDYDQQKCGTA